MSHAAFLPRTPCHPSAFEGPICAAIVDRSGTAIFKCLAPEHSVVSYDDDASNNQVVTGHRPTYRNRQSHVTLHSDPVGTATFRGCCGGMLNTTQQAQLLDRRQAMELV
jgi:hypothetical protein